MEKKIYLDKNKGFGSENTNKYVSVSFRQNESILPYTDFVNDANLLDIYYNERKSSNKLRLTCQLNPICSNVLFNAKTEIISGEGSSNPIVLSDEENSHTVDNAIMKKNTTGWTQHKAIMDTQLSNKQCNFKYHYGIDIFNNHILRNKTFKSSVSGDVALDKTTEENYFNTLFDYVRNSYGGKILSGYNDMNEVSPIIKKMHLYLNEDVYNFSDSIKENLIEKNGWFGFTNKSQLKTLFGNKDNDFSRVNNQENSCNFIEMYPDSELYSFNPKFNEYKNRLEENWKIYVTYPSSSTSDIDFINSVTNSIDCIYYVEKDETIRFYSVPKHNLSIGDYVNIYNDSTNEIVVENAEVKSLGDDSGKNTDFIFNISKNSASISNYWYELTDEDKLHRNFSLYKDGESASTIFKISNNGLYATEDGSSEVYYIVENRVNIDVQSKHVSFKKVTNGEESEYYVRIFSKIPNWKYASSSVTEYNVYENPNTSGLMKSCQTDSTNFEYHIMPICFSKNIYGDDISQIVFTDDIDISNLHDNRGRALSDIYLTLIKNNAGYKEFYGIERQKDYSFYGIEFSHCFGKVNCAFKLSKNSMIDNKYTNVLTLTNVSEGNSMLHNISGYNMNAINDLAEYNDEIYPKNDEQVNYYGDFCEYIKSQDDEQSIQDICFRFNTAQRELSNKNNDSIITVDEIVYDDLDFDGWKTSSYTSSAFSQNGEGYYYNPHFKIPINSISSSLSTSYGNTIDVSKLKISNIEKNEFKILTILNHGLMPGDKFVLFDSFNKNYYDGIVCTNGVINNKLMTVVISSDFDIKSIPNSSYLKILYPDGNYVPSYASLLKDGTVRYKWREIIKNGFDKTSQNEVYPFSNGRLYVNNNCNLYLYRQDPNYDISTYTKDGEGLNNENTLISDIISGSSIDSAVTNNAYNSSGITC